MEKLTFENHLINSLSEIGQDVLLFEILHGGSVQSPVSKQRQRRTACFRSCRLVELCRCFVVKVAAAKSHGDAAAAGSGGSRIHLTTVQQCMPDHSPKLYHQANILLDRRCGDSTVYEPESGPVYMSLMPDPASASSTPGVWGQPHPKPSTPHRPSSGIPHNAPGAGKTV